MRMPNGALASLAGNVDPHHHVAVADLVLAQHDVPGTVRRLVRDHAPDVVGLSVMTFQRQTALQVIALVRALQPGVHVVVGGYDPSLAPDVYEDARIRRRRHRPRRGRHHVPRAAARARERDGDSMRGRRPVVPAAAARFVRNSGAPRQPPRRRRPAAESRRARADRLHDARPADRHRRDLARVHLRLQLLLDHRDARPQLPHLVDRPRHRRHRRRARARRARDLHRRRQHHAERRRASGALCDAIVAAGLQRHRLHRAGHDERHCVGAATISAAAMRRAGFRYVFLGIENVLDQDLAFLQGARQERRARGRPHRRQRHDRTRSTSSIGTACSSSAA